MLRAVIAADSDALCYCFPSACGPARFEQVAASEDLNSEPGKDTASGEIGKSRTHPGGQSQNPHPIPSNRKRRFRDLPLEGEGEDVHAICSVLSIDDGTIMARLFYSLVSIG